MLLQLEAIKFNHDPSSASVDAFNIMKNEREPVAVPEWHGLSINPEDSPAAYALSETSTNTLVIQANVRRDNQDERPIYVRALDANFSQEPVNSPSLSKAEVELLRTLVPNSEGNILGAVEETPVKFNQGETGFQPFNLVKVRIWKTGVAVEDIVWRWQYRVGESGDWIDLAVTTHRIYTTLELPTLPWKPRDLDPSNHHLPWVEVLGHACQWAAGAQDTVQAAEMITKRVNGLGPSVIRYSRGAPYYTDTSEFDCSSFLALLRGKPGKGKRVNCDDCAAIVSTFANAVGCNLSQMCIRPVGKSSFGLKPHRQIGISVLRTGMAFLHHQVASDGCGEEAEVYDACLQLRDPRGFSSAVNLPFGGPTGYRSRLVLLADQPITHPHPNCKRRPFGVATGSEETCTDRVILQEHFNFASWRDSERTGRKLFVSNVFLPHFMSSDLQLIGFQQKGNGVAQTTIHSLWTGLDGAEVVLRVEVYETASWQAARAAVMTILMTLEGPEMEQQEGIGDVSFANAGFDEILLAVGNLVFFLRNVGSQSVSLKEIAQILVKQTLHPPPGTIDDPAPLGTIRRFRFVTEEAAVGANVQLEEVAADALAPRRLYKFIAEKGEVSLVDDQLMYRPRVAGEHKLDIFATDTQGNAVLQTLSLHVE